MARAGANTNKSWYRRYPGVFARTGSWQTRTGRRSRDHAQYLSFRGLDTVNNDFNASKMTSPYMVNWRFPNERYKDQGAQLISRAGTKFLRSYGTVFKDIKPEDMEDELVMTINDQIIVDYSSDELVVGGSIRLRNRSQAKGQLLLHYIKDNKTVCSAAIDLSKVGYQFSNYKYNLIGGVKGEYKIRFEIIEEFDEEYYKLVERPIEIAASGKRTGVKSKRTMPILDSAIREETPKWETTSLTPLIGVATNEVKPFGDIIHVFVKDVPYIIFACEENGQKRIGRFNMETNDIDFLDGGYLAQDAKVFSGVLADGKIVFVDGVSRLRYIDTRDWKIKTANAEKDPSLTAPAGAKYITMINNRIYLANLPDSPNFVTYSMIDSTGAKYFDFHDQFYSPNISTYDSRTTPITGIAQYTSTTLGIWREDGASFYTAPDGFEFGSAKQEDTFSNSIGVAQANDMTLYNGSIYLFNKSEGFRRFSGADATITSASIDNLIRRIPEKSKRYVYAHNKRVHICVDDYALVYDLAGMQSASAWLMDTQQYIHRTVTEQKSDRLWAVHNQYLAFMELNADDVYKDFDCVIPCEYQTQYVHSPDSTGQMLVQRIMAHLSKMSSTNWYVGIDYNHADNPSVWTKPIFKSADKKDNITDEFRNTNTYATSMINIPTRGRCYDAQIRVRGYAHNSHIGINGLTLETQNIVAL